LLRSVNAVLRILELDGWRILTLGLNYPGRRVTMQELNLLRLDDGQLFTHELASKKTLTELQLSHPVFQNEELVID